MFAARARPEPEPEGEAAVSTRDGLTTWHPVDVMFLNIAEMCGSCDGLWNQLRATVRAAGLAEYRCDTWYFTVDIKNWG